MAVNALYRLDPIAHRTIPTEEVNNFMPAVIDPADSVADMKELVNIKDQGQLAKHAANYTEAIRDGNMNRAINVLARMLKDNGPAYAMMLETAIEIINTASTENVNAVFKNVDTEMDAITMVLVTRLMIDSPKSNAYDTYLREKKIDPLNSKLRLTLAGLPAYYNKLQTYECRRRYWSYRPFLLDSGAVNLYKTSDLPGEEVGDTKREKVLEDAIIA